jgi:erythronate-4-phosphate dehydrogenase
MGSFMIYKELCKFTQKPMNSKVETLINRESMVIEEKTLHATLNSIYSFKDDDEVISDISKFEDYRRNYPERLEWHHFKTQFDIPRK